MLKLALAGNPNCGKTTLFNALTGSTAYVGNWPGVTVEKREGKYKKLGEAIDIVDLPGIYSLSPYSPEEVVSRNFLLDEKPDVIINIIDATNLERNLYLTTQILETDVPVVIALNMMDEVERMGDKVDSVALSQKLGVPVVEISALKGKNIHELMKTAKSAAEKPRAAFSVLEKSELAPLVEKARDMLAAREVDNPLFHAVKLIEGDEIELKAHEEDAKVLAELKEGYKSEMFGDDFEACTADARYRYITEKLSSVIVKAERKEKLTRSDKIDKVLTSRIWGIPIFIAMMFLIFHVTFAEDFLYLNTLYGVQVQGWECWWEPGTYVIDGGIPSPGVLLQSCLVWCTDSLSALAANGLASAPAWVSSLICDGVLAGVFSVLSFLPQIALLFLFLSILEDSGYMARVAFIMDRIFRKFGLSGKSFLPLLMGFGCSVPAIMASRTLEHDKERQMTIYMTPWFSCTAKMPIYTAIAAAVFVGNDDLVVFGMYLLGIVCAIAGALLLRNTVFRGETAPFIMELPAYHLPQAKSLFVHLWDKVKKYVIRAATIIAASTIVIWFISNFNWSYHMVDSIEDSIVHDIGSLVSWIFYPLGFALGEYGWVFVVAAVTGLIAKEEVVSTMTVLGIAIGALGAEAGEATAIEALFAVSGITTPAIISFMAFNLLAIPCFAAVGAARAELGKGRGFKGALLWWMASAYVVSMMIYLIGSWWWTVFIFAVIIAAAVTCIVLWNKGKLKFPGKKQKKA